MTLDTDKKFQIQLDMDGAATDQEIELKVLDAEGNVIDDQPWFESIDISIRPMQPIVFKAEMCGEHLKSKSTTTVGTVRAFSNKELKAELKRRGLRTPISSFSDGEILKEYDVRMNVE